MNSNFSTTIPVLFFDGEREIDIGTVTIDKSMDFRKFQFTVSDKIGISSQQITISLIFHKKSKSRKIPINEKVNFGLIAFEKDCYFLAVLKRSRRERRGFKSRQNLIGNDFFSTSPIDVPQKKFSILRRDEVISPSQFGFVSSPPYYDRQFPAPPENNQYDELRYREYQNQLRSLQIQRENNYMMSQISYPYHQDLETEYMFGSRFGNHMSYCKECSVSSNGVPFHWCDAITAGFRSPAGPIAKPRKFFA